MFIILLHTQNDYNSHINRRTHTHSQKYQDSRTFDETSLQEAYIRHIKFEWS